MNELDPMYEKLENLLSNILEPNRPEILGGIISQNYFVPNQSINLI
jgi:hypothetical protein